MRLRLPEQGSQRKRQTGGVNRFTRDPFRHSQLGPQLSLGEKQLKKVLTLEGQIQYHGGRFQIDKDLAR
jgi:hypothetical protein